ncbi:membrane protein insertion efficiency factor YidD [Silvimonas iriomotensis]|uniref:Putative membrane protein insertion efficiency factor n=1 Tax=Silvimonas iriomotensis TaxID=449662 RepID=A0ABQ2PEA0_9NEIS|nr:membrane protein insertion efficiency factor YidD [Silvimonas iriomotensis]GGP23892.1 putative membrane protein insertion efficiency factor [Silvimonas iriomotensis]
MSRLIILLLQIYRYTLSPLLGARCRFTPSCSQYAIEAVTRYGAVKGGWLTMRRLARCHPWGGHGHDPVP